MIAVKHQIGQSAVSQVCFINSLNFKQTESKNIALKTMEEKLKIWVKFTQGESGHLKFQTLIITTGTIGPHIKIALNVSSNQFQIEKIAMIKKYMIDSNTV